MKKLIIIISTAAILGGLSLLVSKLGLRIPLLMKGGQEVVLEYWGLFEPESALQLLIDEYQKKHQNIKINYQMQTLKEYRERVQAAIQRKQGPDIFRFHNTWLPMLKNDLAPVPKTILDNNFFANNFYPVVSKDLKLDDQYYGVPLEIDTLVLFINEDILRDAAISIPTDWVEFKTAAYQIKAQMKSVGTALGTADNVAHFSDILALMLLQNGVEMKNADKTIGVDGSNLGVDAVTFYTSFAQGDNPVWSQEMPNSIQAFASGRAAMIFAPSWRAFEIKTLNPQLPFKIVATPNLPGREVSSREISWATYWVEGVSAQSQNQAQAFDFLKFLLEKETMIKLFSEQSKLRLFGEPYSRVDLAQTLSNDRFLSAVIKQAPSARSWYMASNTGDNGINDTIIKYWQDAINSINNGTSVEKALQTVSQGINQVLSRYQVGQ